MQALATKPPPLDEDLIDGRHYLLLDGLAFASLERWLYEQLDAPVYEPIYLDTRLADCRQLSPCLVRLDKESAVWEAYLKEGARAGWGWLMSSAASLEEVAAHLRWLLFVKHPMEGEKVLHVASPEVMKCLLDAEPQPAESVLLKGLDALWLPTSDGSEITWWHLTTTRQAMMPYTEHFPLQQAHIDSLSRIAWQRFAEELAEHIQTFFTNGPWLHEHKQPLTAAWQIIEITRELGFAGRRAHYYMANILGAHGLAALDETAMPYVARTLLHHDGRTAMERLQAASMKALEARREESA